jgi:uncharacterized membrane-anchored protein
MDKKIATVTLLVILILVNWSIYQKEQHLAHGKSVYLKLAPVDPRSLMQGDYMALRFELSNRIKQALPKEIEVKDGRVVVELNSRSIAKFKSISPQKKLHDNEMLLQYRVRGRKVKFATDAFFFQEGTAKRYEKARYGLFRVNDSGEMLLESLYDKSLKRL